MSVTAASTTRPPGPEPLEASSMPPDDCLGLNEHQGFLPPPPEPMQPSPEEPVGEADSGAVDLLPQREVLQREIGARSDGGPEGGEEGYKQPEHGAESPPVSA